MSDPGEDLNNFFQKEEKQRKDMQERITEAIRRFFVQVMEAFNKIKADYEKGGGKIYIFDESLKKSCITLSMDNEERFTYIIEVRKSPELGCRVKSYFTDSEKDTHYYESHTEDAPQWYILHNIDSERIITIFKTAFQNRYNQNTFYNFKNLGKVLQISEPEKISQRKNQGTNMIKIFISHSNKDEVLVDLLVHLLETALSLEDNSIRCTTLPGYQLTIGAHTSTQLKEEIKGCEILIGVITSNSLKSNYVLFELGAGWVLDKHVASILGPGLTFADLPGPAKETHAMPWQDRHSWESLIEDISKKLSLTKRHPARVSSAIGNIITYQDPQ